MPIEPALRALAEHRQFILCKLVPTFDGKMDKIPVSPHTLQVGIDAHKPEHHASFEEAEAAAAVTGFKVAFVLTDNDPFFCLDLDACYLSSGWSAGALSIVGRFPGCAAEVTQSGRGLHIWGTYEHIPAHRTKPKTKLKLPDVGVELYHTKRFICLGLKGATGNAIQDATGALYSLIDERLAPDPSDPEAGNDWSLGPIAEWKGPADDHELLNRALRSKTSIKAAFGAAASFADLWFRNVEALSKAYPDPQPHKEFDYSQADAALCTHLLWWTGRDCERTKRLMAESGLYREKYEREDYLERTITRVLQHLGSSTSVYREKDAPKPSEAAAPLDAKPRTRDTEAYCTLPEQVALWEGCVYVSGDNAVRLPNGVLAGPHEFNALFGGRIYVLDKENAKTTRKAFEAFTENQAVEFTKVHKGTYRPDLPRGEIYAEGEIRHVNTFIPPIIERLTGYPELFLNHLRLLFGEGERYDTVLYYLANLAQRPGVKFQWAIFIQGVKGNGKSLISKVAASAVGKDYTHWPTPQMLLEDKNAWLAEKLLACVEDVHIPRANVDLMEHMKPMITGEVQAIRKMRKDQQSTQVFCNFILNANDKGSLVIKRDERRYYPIFCRQQNKADMARDGLDDGYFQRLYGWLDNEGGHAIVNEYLHTLPIPDEFGVEWLKGRAPTSPDFEEAVAASRSPLEQEIAEAIAMRLPGLRGGWANSYVVRDLARQACRAAISPKTRDSVMEALGYYPHPGLPGGILQHPLPDGSHPVVYVKSGHLAERITDPKAIYQAYLEAQEKEGMANGNQAATVYKFG